ncbi:MAG: efflux RND transporter periplasmic adaptor subunit [Rhodocyclaceae bacterium]|nr:efflux RND transporter periplasmic adaptor subunit [Rhodocyclaceae bacterium]
MNTASRILPLAAAAGLALAIFVAVQAEQERPPAQPIAHPAQAPYASYIGGAGLVEASSNNVGIGTAIPGIVKSVAVKVGDHLQAGAALFEIDDRELRADLQVKQASLDKAVAALHEAQAALADADAQYALVRDAEDGRAVSRDEVQKRKHAALLAAAKRDSARAETGVARSQRNATQSALERLVVRAPLAAEVLQVNLRPGEYAPAGALATPLVMLGNLERLYIRVNIDENDAWRFRAGTRAQAYLRGNSELTAALNFVRVEPYVTPKQSLTGSSTERVDTRVLQVIYSFERGSLPAYVGQQMDVFIETPEQPPPAPGVPR